MKTLLGVGIAVGLLLATAWPARARDDKLLLPVAAVLEGAEARQKLDGSVKFYFGRQPHRRSSAIFAVMSPTSKPMRSTSRMKRPVNGFFSRL